MQFELTRSLAFVAAILFAGILAGGVAAQAPVNTLTAIRQLSSAEAGKGLPVAFEATVTFFCGDRNYLFVQDGDEGIFVSSTTAARLVPGDRVLIKGVTADSFRPIVQSSDITVVGRGALPKPAHATFGELLRSQYDSVLVTTRGVVRAANLDDPSTAQQPGGALNVVTDGGSMNAYLIRGSAQTLANLLDAEVELTGVAAPQFDSKRQFTGVVLLLPSIANIKVLKPAAGSPWSLAATPINQILSVYHVKDLTRRVKVTGVVTYYEPGAALVIREGDTSLWVMTSSFAPVRVGELADVTGFPTLDNGFPQLAAGEVLDRGIAAPVSPQPASWLQLTSSQHIFDLVSIEGQVAAVVREAALDRYVLVADGYEFSAIYRHLADADLPPLAPMKKVKAGSRVRVTGICVQDYPTPDGQTVHFNILLRSPNDIAVLGEPPWLDVRRSMILAGLVLIVFFAVGMRGWYLERKTRRQIGSLAYVEQRRSRILEDINHSKPLVAILERITELVSVRLNGAPCWCQIVDGASLGNRPADLASASLRTVEHPIASRAGPPLGAIFAAFHARSKPGPGEKEALAMAAGLATLAIETSRLYSDLVHRSEFDLLTDVPNRFVMKRALDTQIQHARQSATIFGLIYLDLNEFKQVNDEFGHQAGDQYLQEVALRMKRLLRPGDTLARLGGDEFAVLVSQVRKRAEVEEIAVRLECCFDEPFEGREFMVHGSASVGIALYPEDADTADGLLRCADDAMYAAKHSRKDAV